MNAYPSVKRYLKCLKHASVNRGTQMITRVAAVLMISFCCVGHVQAQDSKFYYGLAITSTEFDALGLDENGLQLKFGHEFGKFLALEAHLGGSSESTDNLVGDPELTYSAVFLRLNLPFERVNLYVLGGAATLNLDIPGFDDSEFDRAVGVGIDLLASPDNALTIEVMKYGTQDEQDLIDVVNLGFTHRFDFPGLRR